MKLGRNIGSITIPSRPTSVGGLIGWARSVNKTLQELRDRKVSFPAPNSLSIAQPWKCTANGDDTVSVGFGSLFSYEESSFTLREFKYFAGTKALELSPITVTGAGSIYGGVLAGFALTSDINAGGTDSNGDTFEVSILRVFPDESEFESVGITFHTTPPTSSTIMYFEIAKVDLVDDIAVVTRQVMMDNPTLSSWIKAPA